MIRFRDGARAGLLATGLLLASAPLAAQAAAPAGSPGAAATAAPARTPLPECVEGTGPNGAAMRCRDGTFQAVSAGDAACDARGGIAVRFPLKRTPIAPAPAGRRSAPAPAAGAASTAPAVQAAPFASRANVVVPAEPVPACASLQCGDGSYVVQDTRARALRRPRRCPAHLPGGPVRATQTLTDILSHPCTPPADPSAGGVTIPVAGPSLACYNRAHHRTQRRIARAPDPPQSPSPGRARRPQPPLLRP